MTSHFTVWLAALPLWIISPLASAWCVGTASMMVPSGNTLAVSGPSDANIIGNQISDWGGTVTDKMAFAVDTCAAPVYYGYAAPEKAPLPGIIHTSGGTTYPVYATGIPGLGYVIGIKDPNALKWIPINSPKTQTYPATGTGTGPVGDTLGFAAQVKFIATGQILTGSYTVPQQKIATLYVTDRNGKQLATNVPLQLEAIKLNTSMRGCKITQGSSLAVTLPSVIVQEFRGVGSENRASTPFSITLSCDPNISVHATMTDITLPTNTGDFLSATKDSGASGVGLRIYKSNGSTPIKFGPDSSAAGNVNQWLVGSIGTSAGSLMLPFTAKYVQTASTVTPGTLSARASITFSYQ